MRRQGRQFARAVILGILGVAAFQGDSSAASTVEPRSPGVEIVGDPGPNTLVVGITVGDHGTLAAYTFTEPGISNTAPSCTDLGDTVQCPILVTELDSGLGISISTGDGDDSVSGTGGVVVNGGPGDDTVSMGGGDDYLSGGPGADILRGGPGDDTVSYSDHASGVIAKPDGRATSGNSLDGPRGARDLIGTDIENLAGGRGADKLFGTATGNELFGLSGPDRLVGKAGRDHLVGGPGRDRLLGGSGRDQMRGGPGADMVAQ
jgi:Ca2+-binding RTX toxin-like protein